MPCIDRKSQALVKRTPQLEEKTEPLIAQEPGFSQGGGGTPRCVFNYVVALRARMGANRRPPRPAAAR